MYTVAAVCTGNICRSPMGHVILTQLLDEAGLADDVVVSSSGTGDWHVGEPADPRTVATLERHGYDGSAHRAAAFEPTTFDDVDLVLAADYGHVEALTSLAPNEAAAGHIRLMRSFDPALKDLGDDERQTADPWYGQEADFETCFEHVEAACKGLVRELEALYR